jgi:hypothetical protein
MTRVPQVTARDLVRISKARRFEEELAYGQNDDI